jgi:hypothetical protein
MPKFKFEMARSYACLIARVPSPIPSQIFSLLPQHPPAAPQRLYGAVRIQAVINGCPIVTVVQPRLLRELLLLP